MKGIIYKATNTVNGKVYIGQTVGSLAHRRSKHLRDAKGDVANMFHTALYQYPGCFEWEVLDTFCGEAEQVIHALNVAEEYHILKHNSTDPEHGYNSTFGGYSSDKFSEHVKERARALCATSSPVLQYDKEGRFVREYESINAVAAHLGKERCHAKTLFSGLHYGYQWRPKESDAFPRIINKHAPKKQPTKGLLAYGHDGTFFRRFESIKQASETTGIPARSSGPVRDLELYKHRTKPFYFFDDTDEHPDKITIRIITKECKEPKDPRKRVAAYTLDGTFVREYASLSDAAKETNSSATHIAQMCKSPLPLILAPQTTRTTLWRYVDGQPAPQIDVIDLRPKKVEKLVWKLQPDGSKRQVQVTTTEIKANEYNRKMKHKVAQYTHDGNLVRTWDNVHQAALSGAESENFIRKSVAGIPTKRKSNFVWRYVDDAPQTIAPTKTERPTDTIFELDKAGRIIATYSDTADASKKSGFSQAYICNVLAKRILHPRRKFVREADLIAK